MLLYLRALLAQSFRDDKTRPPEFPPVRTFSFSGVRYETGIAQEQVEGHSIRMYDREKTICHAIRYRKVLGEDVAGLFQWELVASDDVLGEETLLASGLQP